LTEHTNSCQSSSVMNERIYQSVRLQYWLLWTVTIALPFLVTYLFCGVFPETSQFHLPLWGGLLAGIGLSVAIHFIIRRLLKHLYLYGTAVYALYRRERKLKAQVEKASVE